jgi:hypothetical protein
MIQLIILTILALLVPAIIPTHWIDHQTSTQRRSYTSEGKRFINFILPRGQPTSRASIIQERKIPRNKGEPNSRATIIKNQITTPRNKGEPTNST